jgi:hypothetical protein
MPALYTEQWLADRLARQKSNTSQGSNPVRETVSERSVKISQEVKHDYKAEFEQQMSLIDLKFEREFYFALPKRRWRSDWHILTTNVLVEFEGGLFAKDKIGHGNVGGILRDIEKYNSAALLGYVVIRITPMHVSSGQALTWVEQAVLLEVFGPT